MEVRTAAPEGELICTIKNEDAALSVSSTTIFRCDFFSIKDDDDDDENSFKKTLIPHEADALSSFFHLKILKAASKMLMKSFFVLL